MKLIKVRLKEIRNFVDTTDIDFSDTSLINTISGGNGSGKTTIFKCIQLCQQSFFARQLRNRDDVNDVIGIELSKLFNNEKAFIEIFFRHNIDGEEIESSFKITAFKYHSDKVLWKLTADDEDWKNIRENWNLKDPKNLIIYVASDKHFIEENISHENISIDTNGNYNQLVIDTILYPDKIFSNIYQQLINDYIRERLVPAKPRKDLYFQVTKVQLKLLLPKIELSNFSGLYFKNQFVLLGKATKEKKINFYDIRNFSSGEKTLFYLLLFINYVQQIGLLIIDEPENHFHEDLLIKFTKLLSDSCSTDNYVDFIFNIANEINFPLTESSKKEYSKFYQDYSLSQVFLLTHSKNLIYNNFSIGSNYYVDGNLHDIEYDNSELTLRSLGLSSVYSKVLFVEGTSDSGFLDSFLNDHNIKIQPLNSCEQVIDTFKKLSKIKQFTKESHFCFLIDRDTRESDEIEKIRTEDSDYFDDNFFILERHEFENYLLEPEIYKAIIEKHQALLPEISGIDTNVILNQIKEFAIQSKEHLLRKELHNLNGNSISKIKEHFRRRDIPVDSQDNYSNFVAQKLDDNDIATELQIRFEDNYNQCTEKYNGDNWEENWMKLCDGKIVLAETISHYSRYLQINHKRLRQEIKATVLQNKEFELNVIIENLIQKYYNNGV